jgi:hypothetical protein
MKHDPLCRQKFAPYEDDNHCRDCEIIFQAKRIGFESGFKDGWEAAHEEWEANG